MPLPTEIRDWIDRSSVDHVGPFVNAWAAFNAWYRHASGKSKDREGLDFVRGNPNSVRSAILPMLDPQTGDTPASVEVKAAVASLHSALEAFRLETLHHDVVEHVSFRAVPLTRRNQLPATSTYRGTVYKIETSRLSGWTSTVINNAGFALATISQDEYNLAELLGHQAYLALSSERRTRLKALYNQCTPRPMVNLLAGNDPVIMVGTIQFRCSCEDLFGGALETIYRMRNMLLHSELKPDPAALACYEPAYHLLRLMLRAIR